MRNQFNKIWGALLALSLILAGCGGAPEVAEPTPQPDAVLTAAAQTAEARLTELAQPTATEAAAPTAMATTPPALAPSPIVTSTLPLGTVPAVGTAPAAGTAAPPAANPPAAGTSGDLLAFSADVTIPDGTEMDPGEAFTKTWRVRNDGTTTWTTDYTFAFLGGAQMGAPDAVPLTQEVAPGQEVEISVNFVAPQESGTVRSNWEMRNAVGEFFPIAVYVEIVVAGGGSTGGTPAAGATTAPSSGDGQVSNATLIVDNPSPEECPHTFVFTASFTLNEASTVTYQLDVELPFEADIPGSQSNSFEAGTQTVAYNLDFSGSFDGTAQFLVTSPNEVASNSISFSCP
jgi:hypothetical protein